MDAELKRRVGALLRPLELAAADNFRGVRRVQGLGHALRNACDGVLQRQHVDALAAWRVTLAGWEQLDENQQAVEVARGMRLLARFPRSSPPAVSRTLPGAAAVPRAPTPAPTPTPTIVHVDVPRARARARSEAATTATSPSVNVDVNENPNVDVHVARARARARSEARSSALPGAPADAPVAELDPLAALTSTLPGIGPAFAERLAEKGLETVEDLLWLVPRRYDDVRDARPLAEVCALAEGTRATLAARVVSARMSFARGRRWAEVRIADAGGGPALAVVRWFNVWAGIDKRMPPGSDVVLSGVVKKREGRTEFANPDILGILIPEGEAKPLPAILARYPEVQGVPPGRLRQACGTACARVGASAEDGVPATVEAAAGLPSLAATLAQLHAPPLTTVAEELAAMNRGDSAWHRRLAFGELFALGVSVALRRKERRSDAAVPCARTAELAAAVAKALPFTPTGAQLRAIGELGDDLGRAVPMNRLLQGDVGSGKTAVAFAAALQVARAKRQVAVMAPTELLAEQHAETWRAWSRTCGLRLELLTGSTPRGVRQSLLALLAAGEIDVLIGTHSLIADSVGFGALGLVVIDEQHRFGVAQRTRLRDKGDGQGAPHLLVMTATPIPRTLALTAYGDLDVSILDELPPGRTPVATRIASGARGRTAAYKLVGDRVAAGERAYIVCPKVEPGEEVPDGKPWKDAVTTATEVAEALPAARVGLVHGRLDILERDRVMRAFKQGELDVLVATTVIEVGVDVPAATVMVIHDADRFGLAQLHQLRGRVGRGGGASHCVLLAQGALGEDAEQRLGAMVATTDGFRIAEQDLLLRGPGELLGPRQAGVPRLRFGDLAQHTALLLEARRHAERILDEDPDLVRPEHGPLRRAIARRVAQSVYGADSG